MLFHFISTYPTALHCKFVIGCFRVPRMGENNYLCSDFWFALSSYQLSLSCTDYIEIVLFFSKWHWYFVRSQTWYFNIRFACPSVLCMSTYCCCIVLLNLIITLLCMQYHSNVHTIYHTGEYLLSCRGVHTVYVRNNNMTRLLTGDVYAANLV